jgi:hypothetical protein
MTVGITPDANAIEGNPGLRDGAEQFCAGAVAVMPEAFFNRNGKAEVMTGVFETPCEADKINGSFFLAHKFGESTPKMTKAAFFKRLL